MLRSNELIRYEIVEMLPALRAFARTFCKNTYDADDLVQETLTKALAASDQFTPGTRMKSWLFTIMRNTFYTSAKKRLREPIGGEDCVSSVPIMAATQEWSCRGHELQEALHRLPAPHRQVLMLIGVLGVSYAETAEICGCEIGTVKSRLSRAKASLAAELGESGPAAASSASEIRTV